MKSRRSDPGTPLPSESHFFSNPRLNSFIVTSHSLFFKLMVFSSTSSVIVLSRIRSLCVVSRHKIADGKAMGRRLRRITVLINGSSNSNIVFKSTTWDVSPSATVMVPSM